MNHVLRSTAVRVAAAACMAAAFAPHSAFGADCGLPAVKPESAGFSAQRLQKLDEAMQAAVEHKTLPGVVTVLARHGKVVDCRAAGYADVDSARPLQVDSIFRIFSMTKPIIGVAMMILYEDGKWRPWEPVEKYVPELAKLKVFAGTDSSGNMVLEDAKHPPTIGELMTHTAGFTMDSSATRRSTSSTSKPISLARRI